MSWVPTTVNKTWDVAANATETYGRAIVNNKVYMIVADATHSSPTNVLTCHMKKSSGGDYIYADKMLTYYNSFKFLSPTDEACDFKFENLSDAAVRIELYEWTDAAEPTGHGGGHR